LITNKKTKKEEKKKTKKEEKKKISNKIFPMNKEDDEIEMH